jgi:hypothetical protein
MFSILAKLIPFVDLDSYNTERSKILDLVSENGLELESLDLDFQNDWEIVEVAVRQNGLALEFASLELQDNEILVRKAVIQNPEAIKFASNRCKNDHIAMGTAARRDPSLLLLAGDAVRGNQTVMHNIIFDQALAFQYAAANVRDHAMTAFNAFTLNASMYPFVSDRLKLDPAFRAAIGFIPDNGG